MSDAAPEIVNVEADAEVFVVDFANGWRLQIPYARYACLRDAAPNQRQHFTFNVKGIHWPEVEEDLSDEGLIRELFKYHVDPKHYDRCHT
ncbi:DUF2442 domain-containing protein [Vreelandella massiliensis]|uniref:DUF2442 domain-containing protein n=1 Tax=Vreelandella massiliensis TaxID=1816686 RepID=UPI00096A648D|nr:DUF2442 domain-containing protein [Halomonas massiliensis]